MQIARILPGMTVVSLSVPKDLRERIVCAAAERGLTAAGLVAELLDERDRHARLESVRTAHSQRDPSYAAEVQTWDAVSADGLT